MDQPAHTKSAMPTRTIVWLIVLCFIGIPLLALPMLFKIDSLSAAVLRQVEVRLGHTVDVASMRVTVFPRLGVELSDVRVLESSTTAPILSARRMEVVLQVLPLLRGQVIGSRVLIEQPHLHVYRDGAGHWALAPPARSSSPREQAENPLALFAVARNVLLTDGRVTGTDDSGPTPKKIQLVTSLQAVTSEEVAGRTAVVHVQGEIPNDSGSAIVGLDGYLIQTRAGDIEGQPGTPGAIQFDGTIRMDRLDIGQLADWSGLRSTLDGWQGPTSVTGRVRLAPRALGYDFIVPEWTAHLRELSFQGEAKLTGMGTGATGFSATFSSSPLSLRRWFDHIPKDGQPEGARRALTERDVDGLITIRTATISGTLGKDAPMEVTAEIGIREGRFLPAAHQLPVEHVSATVFYDRQEIRMVDAQAEYGPIHFSRGGMVVTNVGQDPTIEAHVSSSAQAAGLLRLAQALDAPYLDTFVTGFEQAQGEVVASARFAGRPLSAGSVALVEADVALHDVGLRTPTLPVPLHKVNGRLSFSSGIIRVDTLTGHIGPAQIHSQGTITMAADAAYQDLDIDIAAEAGELKSVLPATISDRRPELRGPIRLAAKVSGPLRAPRIRGAMELQETAVTIPDTVMKPGGTPASIAFDGAVSADRVLVVRKLDLLI
ncbi:MAG TPA: AsmA family protein, partial [Nitrospiraceae bacterium]|nr:AsmA family protein [Nitrospiraceae bacterium]